MEKLLSRLWPHPRTMQITGRFPTPGTIALLGKPNPAHAEDLRQIWRAKGCPRPADQGVSTAGPAYPVLVAADSPAVEPEGYRLSIKPAGATLTASTEAGLAYGFQTLLQIGALCTAGEWPQVEISDWPVYRKRALMVDLGRSVIPPAMLKRLVRILARLKMNQLHVHLYDDEMCGIRFRGLPFGSENPYAITLSDLAELVRYAKGYNVEIMPELEAWGHIGCLAWHRKELAGGRGMYGGCSFKVGEAAFALMRQLISQVCEVMPDRSVIHLGLDEAKWYPDPSLPPGFTPTDLVQRCYDMLQEIGREQGKKFTMQIWADDAGRPVPEAIQDDVIIQPWQYTAYDLFRIDQAVGKYSAMKMRWMAGAGGVGARGEYAATRYWAKQAQKSSNCEGIDICFWEANDFERRFQSIFAGAYYAWNPASPAYFAYMDNYEEYEKALFSIMGRWQSTFRDAFHDEIEKDRGPLVFSGFYHWGPHHGEPAAVTAGNESPWGRHSS